MNKMCSFYNYYKMYVMSSLSNACIDYMQADHFDNFFGLQVNNFALLALKVIILRMYHFPKCNRWVFLM